MIRPAQLLCRLGLVSAALALGAPAISLAVEPTGTTTVPAPASEGTTSTSTAAPTTEQPPVTTTSTPEPAVPQVQTQLSQGSSPGSSSHAGSSHAHSKSSTKAPGSAPEGSTSSGPRVKQKAVSPSALTPSLPLALQSSISGVPGFFIESFRIPPFLLPIYQAAGTAYGIPWQVLAAINEVETDYGRDLSVSSAGAEGWMQFLPAEWAQYGVDANGDGFKDPYNPADAIFAAARYLRAAGGATNIKAGIFSYNHSQAYVESVMLRAQLLGGTPPELLGAITGLTEAHFPVHAASHFSDGFLTVPGAGGAPKTLVGTTIDTQVGAPVIAVQDGEVVKIGDSPTLGHYVTLRDAYGNTYVYGQLGETSSVYPVLEPHVHSAVSNLISRSSEPVPSGPATAGAQPRSPVSEGATISGLSLGAAADLEPAPSTPAPTPSAAPPVLAPTPQTSKVKVFREGANDVYLRPLSVHAQVIAGTVLGHVGAPTNSSAAGVDGQPHIFFQIRPAGVGAPLIDPKPVLDGWVALENTSIFRAKGENPFLATSPSTGQVLLESKQQLEPQVLHDGGIHLSRCGRQDVQTGRIDKRVLAALEYLSVSGLKPTVSGLKCSGAASVARIANAPASADTVAVSITAVNGIPIAGHEGQGSIGDSAVRKLLMLQGISRPRKIVSLLSYPGAPVAVASPSARDAIRIAFSAPGTGAATVAGGLDASLSPSDWIKLTSRLGEIPDPTVGRGPSAAAIPDSPTAAGKGRGANGNG
jgi:murein DD-endopeptidase MepM/ murein hydrolase activator NlpD